MDDGTDPGEVFIISARSGTSPAVRSRTPSVDIWHANSKGGYSFIDGEQAPFNLRRRIQTGDERAIPRTHHRPERLRLSPRRARRAN